ncbi:MAG: YceI family protein [Flavobacterium sp.]|nr:YceI family protein [Flavobacterium sp.]
MRVQVFAILFFVCWQLLWQHTFAQQKTTTKWVVQGGSSLKVDGSTNINKFTCHIINYNTPDTLTITRNKDISLPIMGGKISLNIAAFNCGNPIMTSDLRKTLKYKDFPKLIINFISLSKLPDPSTPNTDITGLVDIELAGVKKRILVNYSFTAFTKDNFRLTGKKDVNFSDFNLKPPRKLGGMIKTNERLDVEFELTLNTL